MGTEIGKAKSKGREKRKRERRGCGLRRKRGEGIRKEGGWRKFGLLRQSYAGTGREGESHNSALYLSLLSPPSIAQGRGATVGHPDTALDLWRAGEDALGVHST